MFMLRSLESPVMKRFTFKKYYITCRNFWGMEPQCWKTPQRAEHSETHLSQWITVFRRPRQKGHEFKASLGYVGKNFTKKKQTEQSKVKINKTAKQKLPQQVKPRLPPYCIPKSVFSFLSLHCLDFYLFFLASSFCVL